MTGPKKAGRSLVLDEPTNDLDLDTLELLEQQLVEWPGTLLLVSHDRRFLDNVVTSTIAFEGGGALQEYVGGYEDYLRQRGSGKNPPGNDKDSSGNDKNLSGADKDSSGSVKSASVKRKKRSFKEEREYNELPERIAALEEEHKVLQARLADSEFYKQGGAIIQEAVDRVDAIDKELLAAMERWDELDSIGQ